MGLNYMGLAGNLDEIAKFYSSRDEAKFQALLSSDKRFVRSLLKLDQEGATNDRQGALRDICIGSKCESFEPSHYGYAMEAVCFQFAESLGEIGAGYGALYEAEAALSEVDGYDLLPEMDVTWFVPIPFMDDWPSVATYSPEQCREKAEGLASAKARLADDLDHVSLDFINTFHKWYETGADTKRDLIFIAH